MLSVLRNRRGLRVTAFTDPLFLLSVVVVVNVVVIRFPREVVSARALGRAVASSERCAVRAVEAELPSTHAASLETRQFFRRAATYANDFDNVAHRAAGRASIMRFRAEISCPMRCWQCSPPGAVVCDGDP
jgi:hypothetical protein